MVSHQISFMQTEAGMLALPFTFLVIMDGLSKLMHKAIMWGTLKGIHIGGNTLLSHILFVDDVLIFLDGSLSDVNEFKDILNTFYNATIMSPNQQIFTITCCE